MPLRFRHRSRAAVLSLVVAALAACSPPPRLEEQVSPRARAAPYPTLSPTAPILRAVTPAPDTDTLAEALDGRAAQLRNRAAGLRTQTVVDAESKARLTEER